MADSPNTNMNLTLIVAATKNLGIGKNGSLPWRLRNEMKYFARVTTRVPETSSTTTATRQNAVVMGRKTWDSIPSKFKPLKDRVNVVLSSSMKQDDVASPTRVARNMDEALDVLRSNEPPIERVFIIGGYAVYKAALERKEMDRVLLTRVHGEEWDCDTSFPVDLEGEQGWRRASGEELREWTGEDAGDVDGVQREGDVEYEFWMYVKE